MSYNGWKNWDTWNASLWASNDYDTYRYIVDSLRGFDLHDVSQNRLAGNIISGALRNCVALGDCRRDGRAWDGIDWDAVDWAAVALGFAEEVAA